MAMDLWLVHWSFVPSVPCQASKRLSSVRISVGVLCFPRDPEKFSVQREPGFCPDFKGNNKRKSPKNLQNKRVSQILERSEE